MKQLSFKEFERLHGRDGWDQRRPITEVVGEYKKHVAKALAAKESIVAKILSKPRRK